MLQARSLLGSSPVSLLPQAVGNQRSACARMICRLTLLVFCKPVSLAEVAEGKWAYAHARDPKASEQGRR